MAKRAGMKTFLLCEPLLVRSEPFGHGKVLDPGAILRRIRMSGKRWLLDVRAAGVWTDNDIVWLRYSADDNPRVTPHREA